VVGQAVRFGSVKYGDGPEVPLGGVAAAVPTAENLQAQEEAVEAQAAAVRALKTDQGLPNSDPQVADAVAALLTLKADLVAMQSALAKAGAQEAQGEGEAASEVEPAAA